MALEPITRQEQIIAGKDLKPITRMEKFLKEYGGGGGGGASHWNELEGKPFVTVGGDTLEWDGNTEGKAVIDLAGDGSALLVCVQEGAPMPDAGASFSVENSDGSTTSGTISSNGEIWQAFDGTKVCAFGTMTDNVSYDGIFTLPKAGIYLPWSSAVYTNSLTIPGYTGFTKEQIDPAVLPDALQFGGEELQTIYEGTDLSVIQNEGLYALELPVEAVFEEGKQYAVSIDGVQYKSVALGMEGAPPVIGNPMIFGVGDDNGLPFVAILFGAGSAGQFGCQSNFNALTISSVEVEKLEPKYFDGQAIFYPGSDIYVYVDEERTVKATASDIKKAIGSRPILLKGDESTYLQVLSVSASGNNGALLVYASLLGTGKTYYTAEYTAS